MDFVTQNWPQLAAYQLTLVCVGILTGIVLVQSFLAGVFVLARGEEMSGMPLTGDHTKRGFRIMRTYGNSAENLPMLLGAVLVAVIAGASPALVNGLVAFHVLMRIGFWYVYYTGTGKPGGGIRTLFYTFGLLANMVLVGVALVALIS